MNIMTPEQYRKILDKAEKYDNRLKRDVEIAKKLNDAGRLLQELAREIDPYLQTGKKRDRGNFETLAAQILAKMQEGREYLIQQVADELKIPYGDAQQITKYLRSTHGVQERRDQLNQRQKVFYLPKVR